MSAKEDDFEGWAILELMGHRRLAGEVRSATIAGAAFVRIDVPSSTTVRPSTTQFYSPSAIYCVTPTTEEMARAIAKHEQPAPVSRFELALPAPSSSEPLGDDAFDEDDEDDEDDDRDDQGDAP